MNKKAMDQINECYKKAKRLFSEGSEELEKIHTEMERLKSQSDEKNRSKETCAEIGKNLIENDRSFLFHYTGDGIGFYRLDYIFPIEIIVVDSHLVVFNWESPHVSDTIDVEKVEEMITSGAIVSKNHESNGSCQIGVTYEFLFDNIKPSEIAERVYYICEDIRDEIFSLWPYIDELSC